MSERKYDSGTQKRKRERNKEQRHQNVLRQILKLTVYFKPAGGSKSPHTKDVDVNNNNIGDDGATLAGAVASSGEGSTVADDTIQTYLDPPTVTAVSDAMVDANLVPDSGCWGKIDENGRKYRITMGPKDTDVAASERQHKQQKMYFSKSLFTRK